MDGGMPRVMYGLSRTFTPNFEAVSRQISTLRGENCGVVVGSLPLLSNPFYLKSSDGLLEGHPLRLPMCPSFHREMSRAEVLHVFSSLPLPRRMRWLIRSFAKAKLLTVISMDPEATAREDFSSWQGVVAECKADFQQLARADIAAENIHLIHSGVGGLSWEEALPPPENIPFTITFASWPFQKSEARSRGLDLLAEAARDLPELRFRVFLRPGSDVSPDAFHFPANVMVERGVVSDWNSIMESTHAVVAPFRDGSKSKSVPNSIIEGMAAGRPAILSRAVGISSLVETEGAGVVFEDGKLALVAAIRNTQQNWTELARNAFSCARRYFQDEPFCHSYAELYKELAYSDDRQEDDLLMGRPR